MKKSITGLILSFLLVITSVLSSCGPKDVEGYMQVSVDGLTASIPDNWVEGDMYEGGIEGAIPDNGDTLVEKYYADKSDSAGVGLMVLDMKRSYELEGEPWGGWQQVMETEGFTKSEFCVMFASVALAEEKNVTRKDMRMLTLGDKEAYELLFTAEIEDIPARANFLAIFGEDHLGIVALFCKEVAWPTFEDCWPRIRESIRLR